MCMWFAGQLNSFLNLGECKEYPIMARSKSIPDSKPSGSGASKEQAATGTAINSSDVKAVVGETTPAEFTPEAKVVPEAKITKDAKATPEPRKLEVVKNESRKNVLPINLEDEIR